MHIRRHIRLVKRIDYILSKHVLLLLLLLLLQHQQLSLSLYI
jgi:hypothetical protein